MRYRNKNANAPGANTDANLVLRQKFMLKYIEVLESLKLVLNVMIAQLLCWTTSANPGNSELSRECVISKQVTSISLTAAKTSDGQKFYSYHLGKKITYFCSFPAPSLYSTK